MRMTFSNRSRKNKRDQKKNCVKRTFESKVTIIRKFSILKAEGAREKVNSNGHNSGFGRPFQSIFFLNPRIFSISTQPNCPKAVWASRFFEKRILLILRRVEIRWEKEKGNSNGHNSGFGRPFDAIFFLNLHIFTISTQPKFRYAVWEIRFFRKRLFARSHTSRNITKKLKWNPTNANGFFE